ncbi:MAG: exonuclease SbcCD subunit D [Anaerolineae bacterium]|nr:MAG: exonuclease SbcCD subunit D [Anaerolineae bacterium]
MKILHFADAHIDMANYGRHDPETGLPVRVMDFLKSLDTIVETAIAERVDLVLFAGDAYKDRNPAPTFQREWGKRIMRLSRAGIPVLLLVGNHDLSPALGRAHALDVFHTLEVPGVYVAARPAFISPEELGIPLQVIALPWVSRSGMMAYLDLHPENTADVYTMLEERITEAVEGWVAARDPHVPLILTAHASVQGATYGGERTVMLGRDLVLSGSLVKNPAFNYVALGHIHKPQDLNEGQQPPVVYPGSIERVDFGEVREDKFFVIAEIEAGKPTRVHWRKLDTRPFLDLHHTITETEDITERLLALLPPPEKLQGAIVRLRLEYPAEWESLIDDAALHRAASEAFEFHLVKRPHTEARVRLQTDGNIGALSPLEVLEKYWRSTHVDEADIAILQSLARDIMAEDTGDSA